MVRPEQQGPDHHRLSCQISPVPARSAANTKRWIGVVSALTAATVTHPSPYLGIPPSPGIPGNDAPGTPKAPKPGRKSYHPATRNETGCLPGLSMVFTSSSQRRSVKKYIVRTTSPSMTIKNQLRNKYSLS